MLNIFNDLIGYTFSCDGSHYMPWKELLDKSLGFCLAHPISQVSVFGVAGSFDLSRHR
jgi:hypothetical protein